MDHRVGRMGQRPHPWLAVQGPLLLRSSAPTSIEGIEKYLASGMIRGIGTVYARKLVKAFGDKVFDVIEAAPDRLREVSGIGPMRAERITSAWAKQKIVCEIMVFLHSHGVGTAPRGAHLQDLRRRRGSGHVGEPVPIGARNPRHRLQDRRCDRNAARHRKAAMVRVRAGISYALTEAMDDGHCGLPRRNWCRSPPPCSRSPPELVQTALELELAERTVIAGYRQREDLHLSALGSYRAEQVIADSILRLASGALPWPAIDPERRCRGSNSKTGRSLADSQAAAIRLALKSKMLVITGGPGVGKTTIVNAILRILAAKGVSLLLCAPTGRAAKRMTEATGFEAKTIHRLLEVDPKTGGFKRGQRQPAGMRPAGRGRDVDGRRHADAAAVRAVPDMPRC